MSTALFTSTDPVTSSQKVVRFVKSDLPLENTFWVLPITLSSFTHPEMVSKRNDLSPYPDQHTPSESLTQSVEVLQAPELSLHTKSSLSSSSSSLVFTENPLSIPPDTGMTTRAIPHLSYSSGVTVLPPRTDFILKEKAVLILHPTQAESN